MHHTAARVLRTSTLLLGAFGICASAHAANVNYQRDVADLPALVAGSRLGLLGVTITPPQPGDPQPTASTNALNIFVTGSNDGFFGVDPATGNLLDQYTGSKIYLLPAALRLDSTSRVAFLAYSPPTDRRLSFINVLGQLVTYDMNTTAQTYNFVDTLGISSLAALSDNEVTALGMDLGGQTVGFTIDRSNGNATPTFGLVTGSGNGELNDAYYESYGPDGLLYVLDFGNQRVQVFAPCRDANNNPCAYPYVRQFPIDAGVENQQFSIGPTGNLYLPDGHGGGYAYDAHGKSLGAFGLPASYVNNEPNYLAVYSAAVNAPGFDPLLMTQDLVMADSLNNVIVLDATGMHLYADNTPTAPTIADLVADVQALGLPRGTANSLLSKLQMAQDALNAGNDALAKSDLGAFINAVTALVKTKRLSATNAANLIAVAQAVIASIPG